ncbi:MAG: NAD(P)/FAD-dependent oxidoreductase [Polyangiaceae bacterium]
MDVICLGSSVNELVLAAKLAKAGRKVTVLEPSAHVGGVAARVEIAPGFRAAVAPAEAGHLSAHVLEPLGLASFAKVELAPMVALGAGAPIVISRDLAVTKTSIAAHASADAEKWDAFTALTHRLAGFLESLYVAPAVALVSPEPSELLSLAGHGLRLRRLGKGDMIEMLRILPMSLRDLLEDWFTTPQLAGALAWTGVANLFQGPLAAGTGFSFLHHSVGRPRGAFGGRVFATSEVDLVTALAGALKKLGVGIRTGARGSVVVENGRATGVRLESGEVLPARAVVSGSDPRRALTEQLAPWHLTPEVSRAVTHVKLRGARAVALFAVGELPRFTGVSAEQAKGTLVHAPSVLHLERAFDAAKHGGLPAAPGLEITIPSLSDPSLAPAGKHVVHVSVQYAPYRLRARANGWDDAARSEIAAAVRSALEALAPGFGASIIGERVFTPADLERDYGLGEGHLYGGELTLDQILFMRPVPGFAHHASPVAGYFLAGDATHPGGGLPGFAGHLAADRVLASLAS